MAKLSWLSAWHIRDETYSKALARLVNHQHCQPFAAHWGEGTTSSSRLPTDNNSEPAAAESKRGRSTFCRTVLKSRPVKTWGPVDGRGHAMFGWPMEEEAKLEFTITVNWRREDGSIATTQLGTLDRSTCRSAEDVGLQLADAKPILGRLQEIVVSE
jgi:hypothetical protein